MKLSTRGRYGLRAMVDLAIHYNEGSVLLKDVARRQMVSLKYLEQLVTPLRAAGLVLGVRGARGGYRLSNPPEEVYISTILQALEGSLAPVECSHDNHPCRLVRRCATHELWDEVHDAISNILENRSLADVANRQLELHAQNSQENMYYI